MFSCFFRPQIEENSKGHGNNLEEKEFDLYNIIEESIYRMIGEVDFEEIINEIFFYTKNKRIGIKQLAKILKEKTHNPDPIMNLFSENFVFVSEPERHVEQLKRLYNDFNIELIILSQLRLLPNDFKKQENFVEHIKDISFAFPERPADMKFNSMVLVFFFLIYSGKIHFEKKISIIYNILNDKSTNYIVGSPSTAGIISDFVNLSLFFIDIEFNSRLKLEALNTSNKEFFSKTKLDSIIFFKKILMIYHNFPKGTLNDMIIYFLHNMFISVKKSESKIKLNDFLANFKSRDYDIFKPSATRSFMMNFLSFNKTFFNLLINSIKHFILHYESIYDDSCASKHLKPKLNNQDYVAEFNMVQNLQILDDIFSKPDYYNNIFKKDFFKVKKEGDQVKEMFVTTASYSKSSNKIKKSTLSSKGFTGYFNKAKEEDKNNIFSNENKDSSRKSTAPTPIRAKNSIGLKEKSANTVNRMKKPKLDIISENEETPYQLNEEKKTIKSKIKKRQINVNEMKMLNHKISERNEGEEDYHDDEIMKKDDIREDNQDINVDIDAMIVNDEQYRFTENKAKDSIERNKYRRISGKNNVIEVKLNLSKRDQENSRHLFNESKKSIKRDPLDFNDSEKDKDFKKDSYDESLLNKRKNRNNHLNEVTPIGVTPDDYNQHEGDNIGKINDRMVSQRIPTENNLSKSSDNEGKVLTESNLLNQSKKIRKSKQSIEEIKGYYPNNDSKHIVIDLRESKPNNQSSKNKGSRQINTSHKIEIEIREPRHDHDTEMKQSIIFDDNVNRESINVNHENLIRQSTQNKEIIDIDLRDNRFSEGNKELSDIEVMERDSEIEKDSIIIDFKEKTDMKIPKDLDGSMFTDTEFVYKKENVPHRGNNDQNQIKIESKIINYEPSKNPFSIKKNTDIENNTINRYHNMTDDHMNFKTSQEPIDIILGQREGKAYIHQNIENSAYKFQSEKVDLNLESLNIVLKPNKNQQSFISHQKSANDNLQSNKMHFNANNINVGLSSSEHLSSNENKAQDNNIEDKVKNKFGSFLKGYLENFNNPNTSAISTLKSGISMLGVKTLQEKLKEKLPKYYYSRLLKYVKGFNSNSVKEILSLNMTVELMNMYFLLLQIYNDYLAETINIHRIKIFDFSLFLNLQLCFTNGNFESLEGYFREEDIFSVYNRIIVPIYVENNIDVNENLILSLFDIKEHVIYFYDAKGILICDMNMIENYKIMFENCFKYLSEKDMIKKENINWKTINDEAIPDFLHEYAVAIILYVAENLAREEVVTFDNDNIDAEHWNERIFVQIAEFFVLLNRKN